MAIFLNVDATASTPLHGHSGWLEVLAYKLGDPALTGTGGMGREIHYAEVTVRWGRAVVSDLLPAAGNGRHFERMILDDLSRANIMIRMTFTDVRVSDVRPDWRNENAAALVYLEISKFELKHFPKPADTLAQGRRT
ncbi:MAG: hypothetical protein HY820_24325 [Acidobacteria bacterium]|nr:hypothetical protein [Acidobacteriota bacterium]